MKPAQLVVLLGGAGVPTAPTLSAPANAAVLDDTTPEFSWSAVPGAVTYDIEIRTTLTGVPTATGIAGTTYTPSALDAALTYSWHVRAVNAAGTPGAWSETRTFSFSYATFISAYDFKVQLKLNEVSGNPINAGTLAGLTITQANCTQAQAGQMGAGEAYSLNGTTSIITINNQATLAGLTSQRWAFLVNPSGLGEGNAGQFFAWANGSSDGRHFLRFRTNNCLEANIWSSGGTGGAAKAYTSDNQVDFINSWTAVFMDYDDADTLGNGRKIRIFRVKVGGALRQLTLGAQNQALTGTVPAQVGALNIFNKGDATQTFAGLGDEVLFGAGLWTVSLMNRVAQYWGLV